MRHSRRRDRLPIRHVVLTALAIIAAIIAVPSSATSETLRVGKAGREAFSFVPVDVGAQVGIFKKHGLDLEISSFGGDAKIQQAMAADGIDVALGSGPALAVIVKGSPIKGIAAMARPPLRVTLRGRTAGPVQSG